MTRSARRAVARVAAVLATVASTVGYLGGLLLAVGGPEQITDLGRWVFGAAFLAFALVGGLIAHRRPGHAVGWLVLMIGATETVLTYGLGTWVQVLDPSASLTATLATVSSAAEAPGPGLGVLLLLLFPTGRPLPGPHWRAAVVATVVWAVASAVAAVAPIWTGAQGVVGVRSSLLAAAPLFLLVGAVGVVRRARRSRGDERGQLQWVAFAGAGLATAFLLSSVGSWLGLPDVVGTLALAVALAGLPAAIAVAVLRHGLYDLGRVVSRTIAYASVSLILAAVYAIVVLGSQAALGPADAPDVVVAGATLVAAALVRPVRRRVQGVVDRRFDRRRYDAVRVIEAFGSRTRDEVDLAELAADLRATVASAVQPAAASLWFVGPYGEGRRS